MAAPIVHVEIPASDTKAAGKFYSNVFSWDLDHDAEFDYIMFRAGSGPGGGFVKVGSSDNSFEYKPGDVLIYLETADIDATLAQVEAQNGKTLTPKTEIPHTGWFAVFADPTGNRIGLYTPMDTPSN